MEFDQEHSKTGSKQAAGGAVWFGSLEELGGDEYVVVAHSEQQAKDALMAAWKEYDRKYTSDYRGQVKFFQDLADIYGAYVRQMPWDKALSPKY